MLTGRRASQTGYGKTHPVLLGMNPTLARVLKAAGYGPRPPWTTRTSRARSATPRASTRTARPGRSRRSSRRWTGRGPSPRTASASSRSARPGAPFLLWLHYVNPARALHAAPALRHGFPGRRVEGRAAESGRSPASTAASPSSGSSPGEDRLGYYVAQYDGEIAAVDQEVGRVLDALAASAGRGRRPCVVLTSDHGESLGEHDYFFDHGENLFDPSLRIPLLLGRARGQARPSERALRHDPRPPARRSWTRSRSPTRRTWPGRASGRRPGVRSGRTARGSTPRTTATSSPTWDRRFKIVATPGGRPRCATRSTIARRTPGRRGTWPRQQPDVLRTAAPGARAFSERVDQEWVRTRRLLEGQPGEDKLSAEACEKLKALGYLQQGCSLDAGARRTSATEGAMAQSFAGAGVALVTPFKKDGSLDEAALRPLREAPGRGRHRRARPLRHHRGERDPRRGRAAAGGRDHARGSGRVPVLAGAGSNDTRTAVEKSKAAAALGRPRHPLRRAVLQQAHAGGLLPALRDDRRRGARCPSSSTTCPGAPGATSTRRRSCAWPGTATSAGSRRPRAASARSWRSFATGPRASRCSPATTPSPWP